MKQWNSISDEQRAYVIAHINDRPRSRVIDESGISRATFYQIVKENGGIVRRELSEKAAWRERIVREHYAEMSGYEIDRKFGFPRNAANKIAERLGLRHSAETEERIRRKHAHDLRTADKNHKAMGERRKAQFRAERARVLGGMKQRTRLRLAKMSPKGRNAKWRMIKVYNYFGQGKDEAHILCYDSETKRKPELEERYNRYGLVFVEADED